MEYDAFISYSHAADGQLAPAIQDGLQRLAKPWHKRRALRVFRDETGLSVNPHLWESIVGALDSSRWFIVLASPEAAGSVWVNREIEHFLATRADARERLLPVVTEGVWEWDDATGGFSPTTNCVPPALAAAFASEPRHLDLSWARSEDHLHLRRADFRSSIADIAAPIHGIPKDELESEDIRIFRRNRRLRRGAVGGLVVLAAGLGLASCAALGFARTARLQQQSAEASAAEAEFQAGLALRAQATAESEADRALAAEGVAQEEAARAAEEAERARLAEADAESEAARAQQAEAAAEAEAERALLAEQEALDAQAETQAALDEVTRERDRADENERQALANADEAAANARDAEANAAEARRNEATAEANAATATRNATTARSNELAARSIATIPTDPELAALLAVEAVYPDGETTTLASGEARNTMGIALRSMTESTTRPLAGRIDAVEYFAVAPDAGIIAVARADTIELLRADDPTTWGITLADPPPTQSAAWSIGRRDLTRFEIDASATRLAIEHGGQVEIVDRTTGRQLTLGDGDLLSLSRDGSRVAVSRPGADRPGDVVVVFATATGAMVREIAVHPPGSNFERLGIGSLSPDGSRLALVQFIPPMNVPVLPDRPDDVVRIVSIDGDAERELRPSSVDRVEWHLGDPLIVDANGNVLWYGPGASEPTTWESPEVDGRFGGFKSVPIAIRRYDQRTGSLVAGIDDDGNLSVASARKPTRRRVPVKATLAWLDESTLLVFDPDTGVVSRQRVGSSLPDPTPPVSPTWDDLERAIQRLIGSESPSVLDAGVDAATGDTIVLFGGVGLSQVGRLSADRTTFDVLDLVGVNDLAEHPDGRVLLGDDDGNIDVLRPDGSFATLANIGAPVGAVVSSVDGTRLAVTSKNIFPGEFARNFAAVMTIDGELLDDLPEYGVVLVDASATDTGFWLGRYLPDFDPPLACTLALPVAGARLSALLGRPSVCTTNPELMG